MPQLPGAEAFHVMQERLKARFAAAREELDLDPDDVLKQERVMVLRAVMDDMELSALPDYNKGLNNRDNLVALQVVLFLLGGSWAGSSNAENPQEGYIDSRCNLKKYNKRDYAKFRKALIEVANNLGMDPKKLPSVIRFDSAGVNI